MRTCVGTDVCILNQEQSDRGHRSHEPIQGQPPRKDLRTCHHHSKVPLPPNDATLGLSPPHLGRGESPDIQPEQGSSTHVSTGLLSPGGQMDICGWDTF